jgi:hypothetical protein
MTSSLTVLFADNKEKVLKFADFGLTAYLAPDEMLKDEAGVSKTSNAIGYPADSAMTTDLRLSSSGSPSTTTPRRKVRHIQCGVCGILYAYRQAPARGALQSRIRTAIQLGSPS